MKSLEETSEGTDLNKYIKQAWRADYVSTKRAQREHEHKKGGAPIGLGESTKGEVHQ